jgi:hypothetical protein
LRDGWKRKFFDLPCGYGFNNFLALVPAGWDRTASCDTVAQAQTGERNTHDRVKSNVRFWFCCSCGRRGQVHLSTPTPGFAAERIYAADFWARPVVWGVVVDERAVGRVAARQPPQLQNAFRPGVRTLELAPDRHLLRAIRAIGTSGNIRSLRPQTGQNRLLPNPDLSSAIDRSCQQPCGRTGAPLN